MKLLKLAKPLAIDYSSLDTFAVKLKTSYTNYTLTPKLDNIYWVVNRSMPNHTASVRLCLLCSYTGRSDAVKRHIRSVHKTPPDDNFVACKDGRVIVTVERPHPGVIRYLKGVCLDCGDTIKNGEIKNQAKNHLTPFINHHCKPKQERNGSVGDSASEASVKPGPTPKSESESEDEDEDEEEPYDPFQNFYETVWNKIENSTSLTDKQKDGILNLFDTNRSNSITYHKEIEIVNYREALLATIEDLANR